MISSDTKASQDFISIRGKPLPLHGLVDPRIYDPAYADSLREQLEHAAPFPHLTLHSLFNPLLLECVLEEFDRFPDDAWRSYRNPHEQTFRSTPQTPLGPASHLYFSLVHSGEFMRFLCRLSGFDNLIADVGLFGGGLHESRAGGRFGIHRDFDRHPQTGLCNRMVLLTYLNREWNSDWGGALELWDVRRQECVTRIAPTFGVSLLMMHGRDSYHGHPAPLHMPEHIRRRSLANYYYSPGAGDIGSETTTTNFLQPSLGYSVAWGTIRHARQWTPPAVWELARKLRRYLEKRVRFV